MTARTILGLPALVALTLTVGCATGTETEEPTRSPSPTATSSPDEIIELSSSNLGESLSYRVRYDAYATIVQTRISTEGELAFTSRLLWVESKLTVDSPMESAQYELLLMQDDLYFNQGTGWYLVRPWRYADRPPELYYFDPDQLNIDYPELVSELEGISDVGPDEIDGATYLHYVGETSEPDADVQLWLRQDDYRPIKVEIATKDRRAQFSSLATYEFFDYDNDSLTYPEPPPNAEPYVSELPYDIQCYDDDYERCLAPQEALFSVSQPACEGKGRRVCLVPVGQVSPELVTGITSFYREQLGLQVGIMTPLAVPADIYGSRGQQIDGSELIDWMAAQLPDERGWVDPEVVMIGITPLDIYTPDNQQWEFVYGVRRKKLTSPLGVVSTFRMDNRVFGEPPDEAAVASRARKMVSKYIGYFYYELPSSHNPASPMFDTIRSRADLDGMADLTPQAVATLGPPTP